MSSTLTASSSEASRSSSVVEARQQAGVEDVVVSTGAGSDGCIYIWEARSGAVLRTLRFGESGVDVGCAGLCLTTEFSYLACAPAGKSGMSCWQLHREQVAVRSATTERASCVAVSLDGAYVAHGTPAGRLHVWQVSSGALIASFDAHFKRVAVLRFSDDAAVLLSGGDDSIVNCWSLAACFHAPSREHHRSAADALLTPWRVWSSHSLPITGIHVGVGGVAARVLTASLDHTCKLWSLASGQLLLSLSFPAAVTCCAMDLAETVAFAGSSDGRIRAVNLLDRPHPAAAAAGLQLFVEPETRSDAYEGHTHVVNTLAVSTDGSLLVSGSADGTACVWDVASRRALRVFHRHTAAVTNVFATLRPPHIAAIATDRFSGVVPLMAPLQKQPLAVAPHLVSVGRQQLHHACAAADPLEERPLAAHDSVADTVQQQRVIIEQLQQRDKRWQATAADLCDLLVDSPPLSNSVQDTKRVRSS